MHVQILDSGLEWWSLHILDFRFLIAVRKEFLVLGIWSLPSFFLLVTFNV